jgi:hypothetical protein
VKSERRPDPGGGVTPRPNRPLLMGLLLVGFVALYAVYGLLSRGTYYDDDISHYLIAKQIWKHPGLAFSTWGRPAFTILYAPVSLFGFSAVRLFSGLLAGVTCLMAAWIARSYGVKRYWLAALFTGFQPELFRLAFSSLTELTFAFLLAGAILAYRRRNWVWMAIAAGWLPLARYETLPIVLVFAFLSLRERRPWLLLLVAAPLLIQNAYGAVQSHSPAALLFPLDQVLGIRKTAFKPDYGTGELLYYIKRLPSGYGWACLLLALYGAFRLRFGVLQGCAALAVAVLSITYRFFPSAGVAGYTRHLAIVAPVVGVLAARGVESLPGISNQRALAVALALGLVALSAGETLRTVRPFRLNPERQTVIQAATWFRSSEYRGRPVLGSHVWFPFAADMDRYDRRKFLPITPENVDSSTVGSVVFWDSHYSHRLQFQTPESKLGDPARFRRIRTWSCDGFRICAIVKIAK